MGQQAVATGYMLHRGVNGAASCGHRLHRGVNGAASYGHRLHAAQRGEWGSKLWPQATCYIEVESTSRRATMN